jgi:cyclase
MNSNPTTTEPTQTSAGRSIRVIPCLDIRDGRVVKGVHFENLRDAGDPVELGEHYDREGADELVFLDITATHEGRAPVIALAERVAESIFIPFTVGGGLRTPQDVRDALLAGADKVSLNSAALQDPGLIGAGADQFGAQCMVVAIDARRIPGTDRWTVFSHGGRIDTQKDAVEWSRECAKRGAGEILLTSMDGDGTLAGYDLELTRRIAEAVPIPVIASGGAGSAQHLIDAVKLGLADAVLIASILHDGTYRIANLKQEMALNGLPVRQVTVR